MTLSSSSIRLDECSRQNHKPSRRHNETYMLIVVQTRYCERHDVTVAGHCDLPLLLFLLFLPVLSGEILTYHPDSGSPGRWGRLNFLRVPPRKGIFVPNFLYPVQATVLANLKASVTNSLMLQKDNIVASF